MSIVLLTLGSVVLVSLVSLVGIFLLWINERLLRKVIFVLISFAVGALLGDVFIHIFPELTEVGEEFVPTASLLILAGIMISFIIEKFIHWHHHHGLDDHDHDHGHTHPVGLICLIGDGVHNTVDGILIAGSFLVDVPTGIATTVAVILHEIPQEIGDFAVLLHSGYTKVQALLLNLVTAFAAILGAVLVLALRGSVPNIEIWLLPLVAGNFIYIAVADLLPELQKQTRLGHSLLQLLGVLAGIGLMYALTLME